MGRLRPCLFEKRQPQKLSHIKPPTPESSGAPSPVGRSKKGFFDKPRGYFCECVNSLNSHFMDQQKPLTHSVAIYHRSEEHTSELQSRGHLVCRLLLEEKNRNGVSA